MAISSFSPNLKHDKHKVLPWKGNVLSLRRGKKKTCHYCKKGGVTKLVKCSNCQKEYFCVDCIKERYFESEEELKMACPVCRGSCGCKTHSTNQDNDNCTEFVHQPGEAAPNRTLINSEALPKEILLLLIGCSRNNSSNLSTLTNRELSRGRAKIFTKKSSLRTCH